jgi:hypothetical protein
MLSWAAKWIDDIIAINPAFEVGSFANIEALKEV